jgi:hypothetical protein
MSNSKKVPGVDDLGDVMKLWEMREEILIALNNNECEGYEFNKEYVLLGRLAIKIESLGKKEK